MITHVRVKCEVVFFFFCEIAMICICNLNINPRKSLLKLSLLFQVIKKCIIHILIIITESQIITIFNLAAFFFTIIKCFNNVLTLFIMRKNKNNNES